MKSRWPRLLVFFAYAALLFTLTHWPGMRVEGPVPRSDLYVHLVAFGTWAALFAACCFFGPALSPANLIRSAVAALVYAAIDESLQAIPALQRNAALDDYAANAGGILLAIGVLLAIGALRRGASPRF